MPASSPSHCPVCGAVVPDGSPAGACSRCLLQAAMQPTGPEEHGRPEPPSLEAVSAAFPHLEILELIGHGGMGAVFKARQPKLDRLVALKLLPASLAQGDPAFEARFEREGRLLARLHHPNIVAVHDSGTAGGFFYLLMEFVEGVNLRQAMRSRRFTSMQALAIVPHICDAMQFAHDEGVLHRDIKPENILLDRKGRVKLADFGIAKLMGEAAFEAQASGATGAAPPPRPDFTQSGATLGTPSYMAPEQREMPGTVDHRADIYSLGVVFYELLTGELPTGSFVPPSTRSETDPRVDAIVAQALEKERTRRQSSAGEVKTQVETVVQNGTPPVTARLLRAGNGVVATPEQLSTATGQMFLYRSKTHLQLTDREFIYTQRDVPVTVPHTAIRDVSIGRLPRAMNWAGLDVLSVTYEESSAAKQIFFIPQEGIFGLPSELNQRVADWAVALRGAVQAATGHIPEITPADQLGVPPGAFGMKVIMLLAMPTAVMFAVLASRSLAGFLVPKLVGIVWVIVIAAGVYGVWALLFGRRTPRSMPRSPLVLGCLALFGLAAMATGAWILLSARSASPPLFTRPVPITAQDSALSPEEIRELREKYEASLGELFDVQMARELDSLRPEGERQGEALAQKEQALAARVAGLRREIEALPPNPPAFNENIGLRR